VIALADQVSAMLPEARPRLGEAGYAELAGRTGQIRRAALLEVNETALLEDKVWLDRTLATLLGLVRDCPRDTEGSG
jgi:hypothetical protein